MPKQSPKGIKKTTDIIASVVTVLLIVLATLPILLQSSKIQNYIANFLVSELSTKLNTSVTIDEVDYQLFNSFRLQGLYVEDLEGDTLLYVKRADLGFSIKNLFKRKIVLNRFEIHDPHIYLKQDSLGEFNFNFIIQAFAKKEKSSSSRIEYQIKQFSLNNSALTFSKQNGKATQAPDVLNIDSLEFTQLNASFVLDVLNSDSISLNVTSLSFLEKSGFELTDFKTMLTGSRKGLYVDFLEVKLPESHISFHEIEFKYDSLGDFGDFANKVQWNVPLKNSSIAFADIRYIAPQLKRMKDSFSIRALLSGRLSSLKFQDVDINYNDALSLNATLELSGLPNLSETFVYGSINDLKADKANVQDVISALSQRPFVLPKELNQLGVVKYRGNISGFFSNMVLFGNLSTNVGSISTDVLIRLGEDLRSFDFKGALKSNNLNIGRLLSNKKFGKASFVINADGMKMGENPLKGDVKALLKEFQFNEYNYRDVSMDGKYDGTGFNGLINLEDKNVNADFSGVIDLSKALPVFDFGLKVYNIDLHALNLIESYPNSSLSFVGKTNMTGSSLDNMNGKLLLDSIQFRYKDKVLDANEILFSSRMTDEYSQVIISSDFVNGSFTGKFKYSTIAATAKSIIRRYLPALATSVKQSKLYENNSMEIDLSIKNTERISEVMELPFMLTGEALLKASVDEETDKIELEAELPAFSWGNRIFEKITVDVKDAQSDLRLNLRAIMLEKSGPISMYLLSNASEDNLTTQIGWQNSQLITNAGEIQAVTHFTKIGDKMRANLKFLPTQIIISDTIWDIRASQVDMNEDSTINVRNFRLENKKQFVHIDGKISKDINDSLNLATNDVNLDYVLDLVKLKGIKIGGFVTGKLTLFSLLKDPVFLADIDVRNFSLNKKPISNAHVFSTWDKKDKKVLLGANFVKPTGDSIAVAQGAYYPAKDSIDVLFDVNGLSIEFLQQYLESVAQNVKGEGYGKIRMFGPMKFLGFEGDVFVDKAQVSIGILQTSYFFNDSIHLKHKSIEFENIQLYDKEKNKGSVNGVIHHDGLFRNMHYAVDLQANNILAMNTNSSDNDYFFGKAYATGTVKIFGDEKETNIQAKVVSKPGTKGSIQMGNVSTALDNSFITFADPQQESNGKKEESKTNTNNFNVKVDLQIEVTPDAEMELIVDPRAGDMISGRGNGNLRVQFDSFSDLKLFGTYTIDEGYYLFTLQTVIRKEFKIDKGSTISWTGSPFDAKVDLRALYSLSASLGDLTDELGGSTNRGNVPVNCVLSLTDDLMKPTIKFEIDLPSSDEGVRQNVRSIINTEEMMNRQIAYLLVLNKFYTPTKSNSVNPSSGWDETISFATSTLSSHLNNWVQKSFNTSNFSIGIDWQKSQTYNDEIKAQLNFQPNKRVILNGNIGYRNDNIASSTNSNKLIGDFDLEYLLFDSGKLRFKAYSHTVDRAQLKEAKSTQGLGVAYKENFDSVGKMLDYYWSMIKSIFTNKSKDENEELSN